MRGNFQFYANVLEVGRADVAAAGGLCQLLIRNLRDNAYRGCFIVQNEDSRIGKQLGISDVLLRLDNRIDIEVIG